METIDRILQEKIASAISPNKVVLIYGARRKMSFNACQRKEFYFGSTCDMQEVDLVEAHNEELSAFGFKWENKMPAVPKAFREAYPQAQYQVVNRENYLEFI